MPFLQLRGRVRLAPRNTDGTPGKWFDPGCPAALSLALTEETFEIIEKCSGFDGVAFRGVRSQGAELSLNLYEATKQNLMLALQATEVSGVTTGSATNEALGSGFLAGDFARVGGADGHQNITVSSVDDTGGPLTEGTDYQVHEEAGMIEFLTAPSGAVTADYTYDDMPKLAMFKAGSKEYFVAFDARNKADNQVPTVLELFRVRFGPLGNLDLLPDEVSTMELTGSALTDDKRDTDDPLGQFGWISHPE